MATAEAVRRGCNFTAMAFTWLTPQCLYVELSTEFDKVGPDGEWEYWKDANGTIPMSREEMAILFDSEGVFYTLGWHNAHCMFTCRQHN